MTALVTIHQETATRPRVVYIGKGGFWETSEATINELSVLRRHLDIGGVTTGPRSRFPLDARVVTLPDVRPGLLGGAFFYSVGPLVALVTARRQNAAIVAKSPYDAAMVAVARRINPRLQRVPLVVEVHGDWRTASRLYGSRLRLLVAPVADRLAALALREASLVRVLGPHTRSLVDGVRSSAEVEEFMPFADYSFFADESVTARPANGPIVFVGALERYKGVDVLVDAWARVAAARPSARLVVIGAGTWERRMRRAIERAGVGGSIDLTGVLDAAGVRAALDASSALVLPSRAEGYGRVILEAFARGRPVIASSVGGISDIVDHGRTGLLVPPGDADVLAGAVCDLLADPAWGDSMGTTARATIDALRPARRHEDAAADLAAWLERARAT